MSECFFIEIRRSGPQPHGWWNGEANHVQSMCWTVDPLKAVRFPRREDADAVILGRDVNAGAWKDVNPFVTGHEFIDAPEAHAEAGYCERHPDTKIIDHSLICGAPQCCPKCCYEADKEAHAEAGEWDRPCKCARCGESFGHRMDYHYALGENEHCPGELIPVERRTRPAPASIPEGLREAAQEVLDLVEGPRRRIGTWRGIRTISNLSAALRASPSAPSEGVGYPVELRCAELEEKLKALDVYLRHHDTCLKAMHYKNTGMDTGTCDCGLDAALKGATP